MRCSFATFYLDAGGSLRDLQDALGHAGPRTTRRYDRARRPADRASGDLVAAYLAGPASPARRAPGRLSTWPATRRGG
jgi:integrase/recombinase XerD